MDGGVPVWLVDRTFSDDEQNLIIVTYATADGELAHRKERAVSSMGTGGVTFPERETVSASNLSPVEDPDTVEWYREAVERVRAETDAA